MSPPSRTRIDRNITAEASAWISQIDSGALSRADIAALREWMARSPAHAHEIREIAKLSGSLATLAEMADPLAAATRERRTARIDQVRRWRAPVGVAAILAVGLVAVAALNAVAPQETPPSAPDIYQTAMGAHQPVVLPDGTVVTLNTQSQIEVLYTERARRVRLISGEALFKVAKDPAREFEVFSREAVARALGTVFVVRLKAEGTEVTVIEGEVGFSSIPVNMAGGREAGEDGAPPPEEMLLLRAGQVALSSPGPADRVQTASLEPAPITTRAIQRKLSWTEGLFDFSDTPLDEVVAELSRYHPISIEIEDPELSKLGFSGIFRTDEIEPLLDALQSLDVEVRQVAENQYRLTRPSPDPE